MIPSFKESSRSPLNPFGGPPLELNSDFGALDGEALGLVERRYGDRGLLVTRERYSSRNEDGDIVCTAKDGDNIVGTLSVRFDGPGGLHADLLFGAEIAEWRSARVKLCEFGGLAVDKHSHDPKRVLAQIFHLGYLHAHRKARCERLVIEVNPRHVAFYRRWLGLLPYTTARHNPRVNAPAVLMSVDFATVREQIALLGGRPELLASARSLYPLAWDEATEAAMLAKLP
ncbi:MULTISPECIES: N-acyl amino acid synthase FeeM domain-containing protein [Roseateles]|uniref:Long-chain N-acyl amino acid synthase n=1 Tax=Pelomonas caseinilytica TaxID=2906763 RepID=A0ABS8XEN1_9BURK|nr:MULTISPECIES: long-chain N-acyl amino acid synthase [unclassified Roseateles]MCE4537028.1 long-chain N-acyl amino acid synthase [Pelomonas sp. P7]HEV6968363.1 long-chain N-acyl amino acid synthase [Roseateles sp.]